jgi:hypothetical protein
LRHVQLLIVGPDPFSTLHSLAAGPNAFVDCCADNCNGDSGPHHRWSVGVLYDNVRLTGNPSLAKSRDAGALNIRNGGNAGTGHGWAGANQVIWNCQVSHIACEQPPTAQNWVIGSIAGSHSGDAYQESNGRPVEPRSLFAAQLRDRLGADGQ